MIYRRDDTKEVTVDIHLPGEPYALKRARAVSIGSHARMYDPTENRNWKAYAADLFREAMSGFKPLEGPLGLFVYAKFTMPKSRHLKKKLRPQEWHTKRPDLDNVVKAVKDAGKGVLWQDDSQVCRLDAQKRTAEQGDPPYIRVIVSMLEELE